MYDIAFFLGAVIGCFLLSRLLWLGAKTWGNSTRKAVFINGVSAGLAIGWSAIGGADGGPPPVGESFIVYGLAQIIVFFIDILRLRRERSQIEAAE